MSIRVRRATEKDLDLLTWVMLAASRSHLERGMWEYLNDADEATTLAFLRQLATTETVHMLHHSLFLIAELDGEPGAAMLGYESATQGFEALAAQLPGATAAIGVDASDPGYVRRAGVLMGGLVAADPGPPGPRWVIENVATKPEMRRKGLVDALLHQLLGHGRERGFETAQIAVYIENERARRAYVKAGFEVVAEDPIGRLGCRRSGVPAPSSCSRRCSPRRLCGGTARNPGRGTAQTGWVRPRRPPSGARASSGCSSA